MITKAMSVSHPEFIIDKLAESATPKQQLRELVQNGIESIQRRCSSGDNTPGRIEIDIDWAWYKSEGSYKICVSDNGDGMTPQEMESYLNHLSVKGASGNQSSRGNFGVGAKITALAFNPYGVVYFSLKNGVGSVMTLHRDPVTGVYGIQGMDTDFGPSYVPILDEEDIDEIKTPLMVRSGTKVTLLGHSADENTRYCRREDGGANSVYVFLTNRYFTLPENIELLVGKVTDNPAEWPRERPSPSGRSDNSDKKTFNYEQIHGLKASLDARLRSKNDDGQRVSGASGVVELSDAVVYWYLFDDGRGMPIKAVQKNMAARGLRTSAVNLVFQEEVYDQRFGNEGRRALAQFGILFGSENFVLCVKPVGDEYTSDLARSEVLRADDKNLIHSWERWGREFAAKMPLEIKRKQDDVMARTETIENTSHEKANKDRLAKMMSILRPTVYRRSSDGQLNAEGELRLGGSPGRGESEQKETGRGNRNENPPPPTRPSSTSPNLFLERITNKNKNKDSNAKPAQINFSNIKCTWISLSTGTRSQEDLEDRACEVIENQVRINADFRGFVDLLRLVNGEVNQDGNQAIFQEVQTVMRAFVQLQLEEIILSVRGLSNRTTWDTDAVRSALSPESLTAAVMSRYHIREQCIRAVRMHLGKVIAKIADPSSDTN